MAGAQVVTVEAEKSTGGDAPKESRRNLLTGGVDVRRSQRGFLCVFLPRYHWTASQGMQTSYRLRKLTFLPFKEAACDAKERRLGDYKARSPRQCFSDLKLHSTWDLVKMQTLTQ